MPGRLSAADVGCWLIKSSLPPAALVPGWTTGRRRLVRCLRAGYRVDLMARGQACVLWCSGAAAGVYAVGAVAGPVRRTGDRPEVELDLRLLAEPVPRTGLVGHAVLRHAEVIRMPAGSNPSYLTPAQAAAVCQSARIPSRARPSSASPS